MLRKTNCRVPKPERRPVCPAWEEAYFDHLFEDCISGKGADGLACNEAELAFLLCDDRPAPTTVSAGLS